MSGYGLAYSPRGYAGYRKGNSNYSCGPQATSALRWVPCAWELLLRGMGISERDALALIGTATPEWARIKEWTRANGYKLFAPEEILCALGMGE